VIAEQTPGVPRGSILAERESVKCRLRGRHDVGGDAIPNR
jgi:hypothetical protein